MNELDISDWVKKFMDIIDIHEFDILILLFFDDPKKISSCIKTLVIQVRDKKNW
jgi:hypothetical protein